MSQAIKTETPSMDEVLTRVRRVIGDDNAAKVAERASETAPPPPEQSADGSAVACSAVATDTPRPE